jgi:glyoxylase-like metal-dependent hydrolase (beta-lactamase superfamily II)
LDDFVNFARLNGFPEDGLQVALHSHPGFKYGSTVHLAFHILKENDAISIGDYLFKCVETPGHTWGHMCLYKPNKRIFVSGDHIFSDITPTIQLWSDEWNPLKEYLASLDKVYELDVELVLPGHRSIFRNCKERIEELKHHHKNRLDEIISIVEKDAMNAFQLASRMKWDIICDPWDLYPVSQKWFATGETISHLKYLEEKGEIRKEVQEQKIIYSTHRT